MSTTSRIMPSTKILEHDKLLFHCMSLIEKTECNDGSSDISTMIILNQIDTILDIFCLDDESIKVTHKSIPNKNTRIHCTLYQRNAVKFLQYCNTK